MISEARAPFVPARRMAMAGIMLRKMPKKSLATSSMGAQEKPLSSRQRRLVNFRERPAMHKSTMSRSRFWPSTGTP